LLLVEEKNYKKLILEALECDGSPTLLGRHFGGTEELGT
jgi:hypothetical protein